MLTKHYNDLKAKMLHQHFIHLKSSGSVQLQRSTLTTEIYPGKHPIEDNKVVITECCIKVVRGWQVTSEKAINKQGQRWCHVETWTGEMELCPASPVTERQVKWLKGGGEVARWTAGQHPWVPGELVVAEYTVTMATFSLHWFPEDVSAMLALVFCLHVTTENRLIDPW